MLSVFAMVVDAGDAETEFDPEVHGTYFEEPTALVSLLRERS